MIDNQGVEMIFDVAASATALAAGEIAKARGKIIMFNGPGSIRLSNEACGPYTVHYVFDTFAQANVTGLAAVKSGLDTWFFLTADYAFGQDLERTPPTWWRNPAARCWAMCAIRSTPRISRRSCCRRRPRRPR